MTREISTKNIAWLAGLYEGEGCLSKTTSTGSSNPWQLKIKMCDEDIILKIPEILGLGTKIYTDNGAWKPAHWSKSYIWKITTREQIQAFLAMVWPYLGERRRAKAAEFLRWNSWTFEKMINA